MRLRTRFTLTLSGLALLVLAVAGASIYLAEDRYLLRKASEEEMKALTNFADGCAASRRAKDGAGLPQYLYSVAQSSGLAFSGFFSMDGTALYHSDPSLRGTKLIPPEAVSELMSYDVAVFPKKDIKTGGRLQILARTVRDGGRPLGIAALGYYPEVLKARRANALRNSLRRLLWVSLGAVLLSLLLAAYLGASLAEPLDGLLQGAKAVGAGDLEHRIALKRDDELGQLADEFDRMAARLQEVDRLKEDFMSSVTHELRSPVSSIIGFADMLLSGEGGALTERQEEWAQTIKASAQRLSGMVDNILDLAKLEAGMLDFEPMEFDLGALAQEVADCFEPLAREQRTELRVRAEDSVKAWADPASIRQVLTNLLSNAFKFTPEGGVVTVDVSAQKNPSGALVQVSDTGPGIPEEAMGKLFGKFFQIRETRARAKAKGTGLGLCICKGLVESQGGKIWAQSPEGLGAVFRFTLPRKS